MSDSYDPVAMATHASMAFPAARTFDVVRDSLQSRRRQTALAFALYGAVSIGFFGAHALAHLGRNCACGLGPDPSMFMWYLAWWPHALLHGINPFFTNAVFAPDRLDIGAVTSVPGVSIVATPMTLLLGPVVSYNVLMLASPALAALFAFLLCRYVSKSFAAGLVGGYLFGFSPYMLGHMLVHLNLVLTFPIPAGVHLVLRLIDGRIGRRQFVVLMALDLAALVLFSTELALTFVVLGLLAFAVAVVVVDDVSARVASAVGTTLIAGVLAAVLTGPVIYFALNGNVTSGYAGIGDTYGGDVLGLVVPSPIIGSGGMSFLAVSAAFNGGNFAESGIYLGLPLAAVLTHYFVTRWRIPAVRLQFVLFMVVVVLLLGAHLRIDGHPTIALPWKWVGELPLLGQVSPVRLGVYMYLLASVVVAMWLGQGRSGLMGVAKWLAALASIAFIVPNLRQGLWATTPSNPAFFTTSEYKRFVQRDETVLTLPWSWRGDSMLWQAETGMWFRIAGGYLGKLFPADYQREPVAPALFDPRVAGQAGSLVTFMKRRNVSAVILDATNPEQWIGVLARLGLRPVRVGGVLFYRVSAAGRWAIAART
jgi:hypothetical protein